MQIELYLREYLAAELETDQVFLMVPHTKPEEFYLVDKLGSSIQNKIITSHVAIQSWGTSVLDALQKNEQIKDIMLNSLPLEADICNVSLNSDYPYHDTAAKHPRYQAVFDIVHY